MFFLKTSHSSFSICLLVFSLIQRSLAGLAGPADVNIDDVLVLHPQLGRSHVRQYQLTIKPSKQTIYIMSL